MPSAKHQQQLQAAIALPAVAPIVDWYRGADPDEVLEQLDSEAQEMCCYDADAAVGYTLYNKLADALNDNERLCIRLSDWIIKTVK